MSRKPTRSASGDRSPSGRPTRKTLQLCEQVRKTLEYVLTGELDDDVLRMMYVASVEPAPDATRLLATVVPLTRDLHPDPVDVTTHLHLHTPQLRAAVATSINRRKAPDILFRYLTTDPAEAAMGRSAFNPQQGEEE